VILGSGSDPSKDWLVFPHSPHSHSFILSHFPSFPSVLTCGTFWMCVCFLPSPLSCWMCWQIDCVILGSGSDPSKDWLVFPHSPHSHSFILSNFPSFPSVLTCGTFWMCVCFLPSLLSCWVCWQIDCVILGSGSDPSKDW
jgi:hypothetical protein